MKTRRRRALLHWPCLALWVGSGASSDPARAQAGAASAGAAARADDKAFGRVEQIVRDFVGSGPLVHDASRMQLEVDPLVENGNSVPVRVRVQSAMTDQEHVTRILLLAPRNPQALVGEFHLGPHSGRADVATRFRMAESQTIRALARCSDGSVLVAQAEVVVTLAACLES